VRSERDVGKREILSGSLPFVYFFDAHVLTMQGCASPTLTTRLADVLQKRTTDRSLKAYTVKIMTERTKSFEYTRKVLRELEGQVYAEIGRLGGNRVLEGIVKGLSLGEEKEE
jgi:geranylgeranyl diphosphate synthase type 3